MDPIGVVRLTVQSAHIIQWSRLRGSSPDPFLSIAINDGEAVEITKHLSHEFDPTWMETKYIVVTSLDDTLNLHLYDYHEHRRHSYLGGAVFNLAKLREDVAPGGIHLPLVRNEKTRGELLVDVIFYPTVEPSDGRAGAGIVLLTISEARRLDGRSSVSGHLNAAAEVSLGYNETPVFTTRRIEGTNDPVWNAKHSFYCASIESGVLSVRIVDVGLKEVDPVVGQLSLRVDDLLDGNEWWPLSGTTTGEARVTATWRALDC